MPARGATARLLLAARVLVLSLLILAIFWIVAFVLVFLAGWLRGVPVAGEGVLPRCAVCGLIAGLFVAAFHLRRETVRLSAGQRGAFVARLSSELREMGYASGAGSGDRLVFRPSARSMLFGANIRVQLDGPSATVAGPKVYLEALRRRLRVYDYLDQADKISCAPVRAKRHAEPAVACCP
jgi:hypothetical protein